MRDDKAEPVTFVAPVVLENGEITHRCFETYEQALAACRKFEKRAKRSLRTRKPKLSL